MTSADPRGEIAIRTIAMPADLNPAGDVFGGWLVAQMDLAGGATAGRRSGGRVATVAIDAMQFHKPLHLGDELSCYCVLVRTGRTSMTYRIEAWARRQGADGEEMITHGTFTFVAIGPDGRPRSVRPDAG